jgi:hypothetical protein
VITQRRESCEEINNNLIAQQKAKTKKFENATKNGPQFGE